MILTTRLHFKNKKRFASSAEQKVPIGWKPVGKEVGDNFVKMKSLCVFRKVKSLSAFAPHAGRITRCGQLILSRHLFYARDV